MGDVWGNHRIEREFVVSVQGYELLNWLYTQKLQALGGWLWPARSATNAIKIGFVTDSQVKGAHVMLAKIQEYEGMKVESINPNNPFEAICFDPRKGKTTTINIGCPGVPMIVMAFRLSPTQDNTVAVKAECLDHTFVAPFRTLTDAMMKEFSIATDNVSSTEKDASSQRGPTMKTIVRARVFRQLKDAHPEWGYDTVAMNACEELGEVVSGESVRNAYRSMRKAAEDSLINDDPDDWKWERADRIR